MAKKAPTSVENSRSFTHKPMQSPALSGTNLLKSGIL